MKKIISCLGVLGMSVMLMGCSAQSSSDTVSGTKILFTYSQEANNTFRDQIAESAQTQAQEQGAELTVVHPKNSVERQVEQIREAVTDGYSAIICIPDDADTAKQLMAAAGDLPIIFINNAPDDDVLEPDQYIYVGSDERVAGQYQAEYVLEQYKDQEEIRVALIKGSKGHAAQVGRTEAIKKTLKESGKKIVYVFDDYGDFDLTKTKELYEVFLRLDQSVDCVLANNDSMALGVVAALNEAGQNPEDTMILGVDATADGCQAIADGDLAFTVYQSATGQGEYAAKAAISLSAGDSIANLDYTTEDCTKVYVPFENVDQTNVSKYLK